MEFPSVDVEAFATWRPAVTLTFDLQNLVRSSEGASEYSLLSCIKTAQGIHEISWYQDLSEWLNAADGQPKNIMLPPTMSGGNGMKECIKKNKWI